MKKNIDLHRLREEIVFTADIFALHGAIEAADHAIGGSQLTEAADELRVIVRREGGGAAQVY